MQNFKATNNFKFVDRLQWVNRETVKDVNQQQGYKTDSMIFKEECDNRNSTRNIIADAKAKGWTKWDDTRKETMYWYESVVNEDHRSVDRHGCTTQQSTGLIGQPETPIPLQDEPGPSTPIAGKGCADHSADTVRNSPDKAKTPPNRHLHNAPDELEGHEQSGESHDETLPAHESSGRSGRSVNKSPVDPSTKGDGKDEQPDLSDAQSSKITGKCKGPPPNSPGSPGSLAASTPHEADATRALAPQADAEEQRRHIMAQGPPAAKKLRKCWGPRCGGPACLGHDQ